MWTDFGKRPAFISRQRVARESEVSSSTSDIRMNRSSSFMIGIPWQQKKPRKRRLEGGIQCAWGLPGKEQGRRHAC